MLSHDSACEKEEMRTAERINIFLFIVTRFNKGATSALSEIQTAFEENF